MSVPTKHNRRLWCGARCMHPAAVGRAAPRRCGRLRGGRRRWRTAVRTIGLVPLATTGLVGRAGGDYWPSRAGGAIPGSCELHRTRRLSASHRTNASETVSTASRSRKSAAVVRSTRCLLLRDFRLRCRSDAVPFHPPNAPIRSAPAARASGRPHAACGKRDRSIALRRRPVAAGA